MAEERISPKELCELLKGDFEEKKHPLIPGKTVEVCKVNKNINVDIELSFVPGTKPMLFVTDRSGQDLIDIEFPYNLSRFEWGPINNISTKSNNLVFRISKEDPTIISGKID